MPQLLQFSFLPLRQLQYDPNKSSYALGQKCLACDKRIIHHEAITVCTCYRYCHQRCLIADLNKQNQQKQENIYKCITCKKIIGITYRMDILNKPHINKINIFLIIVSWILLILTIYASLIAPADVWRTIIHAFILFIQISTLTYAIVNSFMIRQFTAIQIKSTHLGLIVSAFLDLEKDIEEQKTNTELIR